MLVICVSFSMSRTRPGPTTTANFPPVSFIFPEASPNRSSPLSPTEMAGPAAYDTPRHSWGRGGECGEVRGYGQGWCQSDCHQVS